MIDALLYAVRDNIRNAGFGYAAADLCEVMPDQKPPPNAGNIFVAVYATTSRSAMRRNLDEYFSFGVCLTMRVTAPLGRIGDAQLTSKVARISMNGQPSFTARIEQLRGFLHMNWNVMGQFDAVNTWTLNSANWWLAALSPTSLGTVYGFVEPAKYAGREEPKLVGPDWFASEPGNSDYPSGIKCELRFEDARRMQPQTAAVGPYG